MLTPDSAEIVLDTVNLEAGTYVGTRLLVNSIYVEVHVNRDGDTLDENVEVVLTEAEFASLPPGPGKPEAPEKPEAPTGEKTPPTKPEAPADGEELPPEDGQQPQEPEEPEEPEEHGYRIKIDGLVYMGQYLDEKHYATLSNLDEVYMATLWETNFVYGGSGGIIIYDFTLYPLESKGEQISVRVSTTSE